MVERQDKNFVSTGMISKLRKCPYYFGKQEIQKLFQKIIYKLGRRRKAGGLLPTNYVVEKGESKSYVVSRWPLIGFIICS